MTILIGQDLACGYIVSHFTWLHSRILLIMPFKNVKTIWGLRSFKEHILIGRYIIDMFGREITKWWANDEH